MKLTQTLAAVALTAVASNASALIVSGTSTGEFTKVASDSTNSLLTGCTAGSNCSGFTWGDVYDHSQYLSPGVMEPGSTNPNKVRSSLVYTGAGNVNVNTQYSDPSRVSPFSSSLNNPFIFGSMRFINGEILNGSTSVNFSTSLSFINPNPTSPVNPFVKELGFNLVNTGGTQTTDKISYTLTGGNSFTFMSGSDTFKFTFLGSRERGTTNEFSKSFTAPENNNGQAWTDRQGVTHQDNPVHFDFYGKLVKVSEPASVALFGLGLLGLAGARRKKA